MHGDRDVVSDRAVRSVLVVVSTPILQLFAGVGKAHEPVGIQALGPELAVERLDEPIVGGFAGPREVQNDVVGIGPEIEIPGDELTAVARQEAGRFSRLKPRAEPSHRAAVEPPDYSTTESCSASWQKKSSGRGRSMFMCTLARSYCGRSEWNSPM